MKKLIILMVLVFIVSLNTYAFELVEVEDTSKYSLGMEYGYLVKADGVGYYYGLSAALKINEKTYIRSVIGKATDLEADKLKLLVLAKPMYCFNKSINSKFYGFGLLGNFEDDLSLGAGIGYEEGLMAGEVAYTTDQIVLISGCYNIYF